MPAEASPAIPDEVGGGIVLSVDLDHFLVTSQLPAREEMARPSQGIYTGPEDIARLHAATGWVLGNKDRVRDEYEVTRDGIAVRRDGWAIRPEDFKIL